MLKALELYGFKSFADKTRFEFPHGITVVVGPNGSGKSNVVDAIRWVLGEQSAKSLRGSEMADVIFKGSGTGQRKPSNTAEVTIIFDNQQRVLDVDSAEVLVTRRVYRSGEGEYLINGEPCRLRDIKDLFRGTGVGTDTYSLIEQGKVDTLLQASPRERRAIFEEAAGISRFKAKKVESQRRLDRVQQNLLRLSDIVEEVERRLRSLRNQATKARRYKEYTDRLQSLRTYVGLTDYRQISAELHQVESQLAAVGDQLTALTDTTRAVEEEVTSLDGRLATIEIDVTDIGQSLAKNREVIASHEATIQLQRRQIAQLEEEELRCRKQHLVLNSRAGNVQLQLQQIQEQLNAAEQERDLASSRAATASQQLKQLDEQLLARRTQVQHVRHKHADQLQEIARLSTQLSGLESELSLAHRSIARDEERRARLQTQLQQIKEEKQGFEAREAELRNQLDQATSELELAQHERDSVAANVTVLQQQLAERQQRLTAATERAKVLEEVEKRLEGIGAGTKDLLAQARSGAVGSLGEVRGMVADLIEVRVEMAPLIDAALGERAQFIVVAGQRTMRAVASGALTLRGRVGLISLASISQPATGNEVSLAGEEGVLGRATDFIQVDPLWRDLADFLLGSTWLVESLESAWQLQLRQCDSTGRVPRFVTRSGEVLEADGTMCGGPRQASGGLVSRRSELRSLRTQIQQDNAETSVLGQKLAGQREALAACDQRLKEWSAARKDAGDAYAEAHARAETARQSECQTEIAHQSLQEDLSNLKTRQAELAAQQAATMATLDGRQKSVAELERRLAEQQSAIAELDEDRLATEATATATKIKLAKVEQQIETLRMQALRCRQDSEERTRAMRDVRQTLAHCQSRHRETSRDILRASSLVAEYHLEQQSAHHRLRQLHAERDRIAADRVARLGRAQSLREQVRATEKTQHALELQAGELGLKREGVAERVRDDYGIELSSIEQQLSEELERAEIDQEIADLRRKISNIGAVNMESLAELEELEERFGTLSTQHDDLVQAKESLERIINRINADSRRMFVQTLDAIRKSFQLLFRRAFGGGNADILIEDETDVLESGIDIVATPPGKHSLHISLLSGGERALTAVTLLLAIFRYRPSPFCILDEVDGPLDEANIGRFVDVLSEFLDQTKVVIVTHSKKTMSSATTLYGVTMQESGVSKRVSVQFSDVSEDGSIREGQDGEAA